MTSPRLIIAGAAALLLLIVAAVLLPRPSGEPQARPMTMRAGAYEPAIAAPDFALLGSNGREIRLSEFRGKVVLLTFGFTYCAAVCPTTLATLAQARAGLGKVGDEVQVVFVTVDPERDTAAQMKDYLSSFDPSFSGATGSPQALAAVRKGYGITATKEGSGDNYAFAHTSSIFLIDRAGKLRAMMPFGRDAADYVHDLKLLLAK